MNNDGKKVKYVLFRQNIESRVQKNKLHLIKLSFTIAQNAPYLWFSKASL